MKFIVPWVGIKVKENHKENDRFDPILAIPSIKIKQDQMNTNVCIHNPLILLRIYPKGKIPTYKDFKYCIIH